MFVPVNMRTGEFNAAPFEQLIADVEDMTTPLEAIGERIRLGVSEQFDSQGAWGGRPWSQLTFNYRKWKASHAPGLPILIGLRPLKQGTRANPTRPQTYAPSGKMHLEMIAPSAVAITPKRLVYAPESKIAGFHQEGTPRMAARPPLALPLSELAQWNNVFDVWLSALVDKVNA